MNPESIIVASIVALSSGGGLVAFYRARQDKKKGVREADAAEATSAIDGFRALVTDLRSEVDRLKKDRALDSERIDQIEKQISVERDLRWSAIQYVRILLAWVTQHVPEEQPPAVPHDLADHVAVPRKDHP